MRPSASTKRASRSQLESQRARRLAVAASLALHLLLGWALLDSLRPQDFLGGPPEVRVALTTAEETHPADAQQGPDADALDDLWFDPIPRPLLTAHLSAPDAQEDQLEHDPLLEVAPAEVLEQAPTAAFPLLTANPWLAGRGSPSPAAQLPPPTELPAPGIANAPARKPPGAPPAPSAAQAPQSAAAQPVSLVHAPNPALYYPYEARRQGWQGETLVEVELAANGRVTRTRILRSSGYEGLDSAAVRYALAVRFNVGAPGRTAYLPVRFELAEPLSSRRTP